MSKQPRDPKTGRFVKKKEANFNLKKRSEAKRANMYLRGHQRTKKVVCNTPRQTASQARNKRVATRANKYIKQGTNKKEAWRRAHREIKR